MIQQQKLCIYCTLPEIKNREILRNELARSFLTNIPITPGHILISPIDCKKTLSDLTKDRRPVLLSWYCCFNNKTKALRFEKYLKVGSGFVFSRKRLV